MAMIDYGAIAFKNGKLISTEMFTPMIDMIGWQDTESDVVANYSNPRLYERPINLKGNYFAYIGDEDYTICFYKGIIRIVERFNRGRFYVEDENFYASGYKWHKWLGNAAECDDVKVTKRNGYFVCKWKYKGDKYKVYFGHGVDLSYYKKWRIVNYYRSPAYRMAQIKRWIKYKTNQI